MQINKPQDFSLKSLRKSLQKKGQFYTDERLAEILKNHLPEATTPILDPTCGHGALFAVFGAEIEKYGFDIEAESVKWARENIPNCFAQVQDFLEIEPETKFERIIANPPFSVAWKHKDSQLAPKMLSEVGKLPPRSKADWVFLFQILQFLSEDGTAVVLNFPGVLYRSGTEADFRKYFIEKNFIEKVMFVPGGFFEDTKIATALIVLKKNRQKKTILFENLEKNLKREVEVEEIAKNDFNLSFNLYLVEPEPEKEKIDPRELELQCRQACWRSIERSLRWSQMVCQYENWDFEEYREFLISKLREF